MPSSPSCNEGTYATVNDQLRFGTAIMDCGPELTDNYQLLTPLPESTDFELCRTSEVDFSLDMVQSNLQAISMPATKLSFECSPIINGPDELEKRELTINRFTEDPICDLEKADVCRLIQQWSDTVGAVYPISDRQKLLDQADRVFSRLQPVQPNEIQLQRMGIWQQTALGDETKKLNMVLAISCILENGSQNDQAQRLFQSVVQPGDSLIWNVKNVDGIHLLFLIVGNYFIQYSYDKTNRKLGFISLSPGRQHSHRSNNWNGGNTMP